MRRMLPLVLLVALSAAPLAGCGETASPSSSPSTRHVSAADVSPWPFSVREGTLRCGLDGVTFQPDGGAIYAVNGRAKGSGKYQELTVTDPLWLDDTTSEVKLDPPLKVSVSNLIHEGLRLCNK